MSRIYFHTPTETVEVYGSERAFMAALVSKMAAGIFDLMRWERKRDLMPHGRRDYGDQLGIALRVDERFASMISVGFECAFSDGQEISDVVLNTALKLGSRPVQLAARIHGQCEIHGYVEPQDGEFIASIIEEGLAAGVFRENLPRDGVPTEEKSGWREACRVLRSGEIVVTSYSVCDGFPNAYVASEGGAWTVPLIGDRQPTDRVEGDDPEEKDWDVWYDLPDQERWDLAVKALRTGINGLRWSEENWDRFYFGTGRHALGYVNHEYDSAASRGQDRS